MKLTDLNYQDYISILMKGPPGFGKTISAASFARQGPVWLAYFDKKSPIELVQFYKKYAPELLKNIDYDVYGSSNANQYLNKMIDFTSGCKYVAIITDSLTNLTSAAVNWSLGFRSEKGGTSKSKLMPDFDEYKVETSLVTQVLDIGKTLPTNVIWTCHPVPSTKIEGTGNTMRVSKVNSIVTYGSKVAGIVPGNFSEIYHFSKRVDWNSSKSETHYYVSTEAIGDEYAKSNIGLKNEMDITNRLFYDVWKEEINKLEAETKTDDTKQIAESQNANPFKPFKM